MANKLLILGAAMAHKNKSYNLSNAISKGVDKAVDTFGKIITAKQQRLDKIKAANDAVTGQVNNYLAQLDPENLNLDLVPDPIRKAYYGALNGAKSELGKLLIEQSGSNASLYAPGTDGYMEMQDKINAQRKKIDKLYKNATKFQQINANWFNEHGNISDAWKTMNPELYAAMGNILNTENPNYTVELDDAGDWVISTDIDVVNDPIRELGPDDNPSAMPSATTGTKNVKVKLDDLDWEQTAMPEIKYINDVMQAGIDAGRQGQTLTGPQINEMIAGFDARIGDSEGALYSLMFDELPIGNMGGKMSLFTDEQFAEDYPNFDADDPSTYPDFEEMKQKTIDRLVGMIKEENAKAGGGGFNYVNNPDLTPGESQRRAAAVSKIVNFMNFMNGIKDLSPLQIASAIKEKSGFSGGIDKVDGFKMLPNKSSVGQSVTAEFSIKDEINEFKKGNINPLLQKLLNKTSNSEGRAKSDSDIRGVSLMTQEQRDEYIIGNL